MINSQTQIDAVSIADKLLQQLEDEYMAVVGQNIPVPKQNIEPEADPENPYQPLQFDDQQDSQVSDSQIAQQQPQHESLKAHNQEPFQNQTAEQVISQIHKMRVTQQHQSNPEIKQLVEVPPTDESIFTNLPHKDFEIDQDKIKTFALSFGIEEPDWLKDENLCKAKIQQLFTKKPAKPFTKI